MESMWNCGSVSSTPLSQLEAWEVQWATKPWQCFVPLTCLANNARAKIAKISKKYDLKSSASKLLDGTQVYYIISIFGKDMI